MGNLLGKKPHVDKTRESVRSQDQTEKNFGDVDVKRLRDDLNRKPELFILNNILMSIQFYENFEREMSTLRKKPVSEKEVELNKALSEYQKHCILPDTVMDCINKRVRYRPSHGPKKLFSEPLLQQRMFIIHDNVEVYDEMDSSDYSTVGGPVHIAVIDNSENDGYVKLKIKDHNATTDIASDTDSFKLQCNSPMTTNKTRLFTKNPLGSPSNLLKDAPQFTFPENRQTSEPRKTSLKEKIIRTQSFSLSGNKNISATKKQFLSMENISKISKDSENYDNTAEYGYSNLLRITAEKPLNETNVHKNISNLSLIPPNCITEIQIMKHLDLNDDDDSDDSVGEDGKRRPPVRRPMQDFYEIQRYFNSIEFFDHFRNIFNNIYSTLGFTLEHKQKATSEGGKIHCKKNDPSGNEICYEVIPSVQTKWPGFAFEFRHRPRNTIIRTHINYKWPTDNMLDKIMSLQTQVLPSGFVAKRGENENRHIEWICSFPAAERYLITCMSHSQIRCYLFIMALYKTFLEPPNTKLGLSPHHILTVMFWEIENNYLAWHEDRLGTKIISLLKTLKKHLGIGHLPDYFVRERNLLESCPSRYLRISQANLHNIIEKPVMHILIAMRNLRYTSGTFFPVLNFKELHKLLIIKDDDGVLQHRNPKMPKRIVVNKNLVKKTPKSVDWEKEWYVKRNKQWKVQKKDEKKNLETLRKVSVDSIDLINVPMCALKRSVLIEFFIKHFLEVAKKCCEYDSCTYTQLILEHCTFLVTLLKEQPDGETEATSLSRKIFTEKEKCHSKRQQAMPRVNNTQKTRGVVKFPLPSVKNNENTEGNTVFERKNRPNNIKLTEMNHQQKVPNDRQESRTILADMHVQHNSKNEAITKMSKSPIAIHAAKSHENDSDSEIETTDI